MSRSPHQRLDNNEIRFVDAGESGLQEWDGYQAYSSDVRPEPNMPIQERRNSRQQDSPTSHGSEFDTERNAIKFISAVSNVSAGSDDDYKNRYKKALLQLNKVLVANKMMKVQMEGVRRELSEVHEQHAEPKNMLIENQMEELRLINQQLDSKIHEILLINHQFQEESKESKQNLRREVEKHSELVWRLNTKEQELIAVKDNCERQLEDLDDTIKKLESANTSFKQQEMNLREMYGGKEETNNKKILFLQNQLSDTKVQLMKEREKVTTDIQSMSMKIRKQAQSQLANYKLEMTRLKQINTDTQREVEKLTKELRQATQKKVEKRSSEHRHVSELQEQVENCKKEIRRLKETTANTHHIQIQKQSLEKELKMLSSNLASMTQESAQAKARIGALQQESTSAESVNQRLQAEISRLSVEVDKQQIQIKKKDAVISRLKGENEILKDRLLRVETDREKPEGSTRGNLGEIQSRIRQLKDKVNLLNAGRHMFEEDKEDMEREKIETINSMAEAVEEKTNLLISQNSELGRRLQHYKQKATIFQKKLDSSVNENKISASKLESYETLVSKLQTELQRAINKSSFLPPPLLSPQFMKPSDAFLNDKVKQLNDRLLLESKYAKQELQTKCLEYDSKMVAAKLEISKLKEALKGQSFFHNRITELSLKLSDTQNKKLELIKKVGQLDREKLLAQRIPSGVHKELEKSQNDLLEAAKKIQELSHVIVVKEKELAKERGSRIEVNNPIAQKHHQSSLERKQLLTKIRNLEISNHSLTEYKAYTQERILILQTQISRNQSTRHSEYTPRFDLASQGQLSPDEIQELRDEVTFLREIQISYFQLEAKSSTVISSFEQLKLKYQSCLTQIGALREEIHSLKTEESEYVFKVQNMQIMFDTVCKKLEDALIQKSELINQANALKRSPNLQHGVHFQQEGLNHSNQHRDQMVIQQVRYFDNSPPPQASRFRSDYSNNRASDQIFMHKRASNEYEMQFKDDDDGGLY